MKARPELPHFPLFAVDIITAVHSPTSSRDIQQNDRKQEQKKFHDPCPSSYELLRTNPTLPDFGCEISLKNDASMTTHISLLEMAQRFCFYLLDIIY
jgi:hypothetical protein